MPHTTGIDEAEIVILVSGTTSAGDILPAPRRSRDRCQASYGALRTVEIHLHSIGHHDHLISQWQCENNGNHGTSDLAKGIQAEF